MNKTIERQKDWPAWAEWFAVDGNGDEWVYGEEPRRSNRNDYWIAKGLAGPRACMHDTESNNYGLRKDWGSTLLRIVDAPVKEVQGSVDLETANHKCKVFVELRKDGGVRAAIPGYTYSGIDERKDAWWWRSLGWAEEKKALPEREFKPGDKFMTRDGDVVTFVKLDGDFVIGGWHCFMGEKYVIVSACKNLPSPITQKAIDAAFGVGRFLPMPADGIREKNGGE